MLTRGEGINLGLLEVNQIKERITSIFRDKIDVKGVANSEEENVFLSRALAGYSIHTLYPEIELSEIVDRIVDGSDDNGIDAFYFVKEDKTLCLVQSKFNHKGDKEPELGEVKKFTGGINDLIQMKFNKFNSKLRKFENEIRDALSLSDLKIKIILTYTATNFSEHSSTEISELLNEFNSCREVAYFELFNQNRLHSSLFNANRTRFVNERIGLLEWGTYESSSKAYYGQISAMQLFELWKLYGDALFDLNIRKVLRSTDVHDNIVRTLDSEPTEFWFYNNGITITCESVTKATAYGNKREFGEFDIKGLSIVNGAQTVGTIGKYGLLSEENRKNLENAYLNIKIIEIMKADEENRTYYDEHFAQQITTANNTQNKVIGRDFVCFDPIQKKIANDLSVIGVKYHVSRSENAYSDDSNFTVEEAAEALSYAKDIDATITISREPGSIYSDLNHSRYKKLFNPGITSYYVWNCVNIFREIDKTLGNVRNDLEDESVITLSIYGKGILQKIVFDNIKNSNVGRYSVNWNENVSSINMKQIIFRALDIIKTSIENIDKPLINIFKSPNDIRYIYQQISDAFGTEKIEEEPQPSIADIDGLSVADRRKLESFESKLETDEIAQKAFKFWATKLYSVSRHQFGYKSNIQHYIKEDGKVATETFVMRLAYYTKLIISFEHHNYGNNYKSILFQKHDFEKWALENLDENMKIVVDNEEALHKILELTKFF